ncbi:hypothetical protein [Microcoleus sp. FACHB-672]|uniref:hypothetical protein n=1 Tax=Microcoleus sp. FACHB-672 TaxID=2692825 RepID=UPI00168754B9|nr:hypothetical protein [Microcoleus sp. FACHB-672]MBD2041864.1 hypothetical protein [Microcoleus sp. FACHB-672]
MASATVLNNSQVPDLNLVEPALQALTKFENSKVAGVWSGLEQQKVIEQMRARITNPFNINQGRQPFCGPAAVLFELVRKHPSRYVEICSNLFQIGGFHAQSKWIPTSDSLRENRGELQMDEADWMVLSTLRESENILFAVEPDAPDIIRNLSGMTKSWEMKGWVAEVLGYREVKYHHAFVMGDFDAMREAAEVLDAGGVAFALVNSDGLLTDKQPMMPYPSHWIALVGNISMPSNPINENISFDIYTWARKMHVEADALSFKKYFWGVVTGRP